MKNKFLTSVVILLMLAILVLGILNFSKLTQQTMYSEGYFDAPFFGTIQCSLDTGSKQTSGSVSLPPGEQIIRCPTNTKDCDVLISFPSRSWYTTFRRISYYKCNLGGGSCNTVLYYPEANGNIPNSGLNNHLLDILPQNKELRIKFEAKSVVGFSWSDADETGSYKLQFNPYLLWYKDSLAGGITKMSGSVDCKVPIYDKTWTERIIDATIKDSSGATADEFSTSNIMNDGQLRPEEAYNYVSGTVVRNLAGNSITYNGQTAYCIQHPQGSTRAYIYAIGTLETASSKYNIVDLNTKLAEVDCCNNGVIEVNRICKNYLWETLVVDETTGVTNQDCSINALCPIGRIPYSTTSSFEFRCVEGFCKIVDIKVEDCNGNEECKPTESCINFKCEVITTIPTSGDEELIPDTSINGPADCPWYTNYKEAKVEVKSWYNYIGFGKPRVYTENQCEPWLASTAIWFIIILIIVLILYGVGRWYRIIPAPPKKNVRK